MNRYPAVLAGSIAITLVLAVVALGLGRFPIGIADVVRALVDRSQVPEAVAQVVWNVRLPRIAGALLVGAARRPGEREGGEVGVGPGERGEGIGEALDERGQHGAGGVILAPVGPLPAGH